MKVTVNFRFSRAASLGQVLGFQIAPAPENIVVSYGQFGSLGLNRELAAIADLGYLVCSDPQLQQTSNDLGFFSLQEEHSHDSGSLGWFS